MSQQLLLIVNQILWIIKVFLVSFIISFRLKVYSISKSPFNIFRIILSIFNLNLIIIYYIYNRPYFIFLYFFHSLNVFNYNKITSLKIVLCFKFYSSWILVGYIFNFKLFFKSKSISIVNLIKVIKNILKIHQRPAIYPLFIFFLTIKRNAL